MNYVKLAATAKRLIEKNGRTVTFNQKSETAADENKPWRGTETDPEDVEDILAIQATALFVEREFLEDVVKYGSQDHKDTTMRVDASLIVAATSVVDDEGDQIDLKAFDTVADGSDVYRILQVGEVKPGDTRLLWKLNLAR